MESELSVGVSWEPLPFQYCLREGGWFSLRPSYSFNCGLRSHCTSFGFLCEVYSCFVVLGFSFLLSEIYLYEHGYICLCGCLHHVHAVLTEARRGHQVPLELESHELVGSWDGTPVLSIRVRSVLNHWAISWSTTFFFWCLLQMKMLRV